MKRILLSGLLAFSLYFSANAQSVTTATSYSDNFNDNAVAASADDGWYNDVTAYSTVTEVSGKLNVVCAGVDQYFKGFGLYLKPATAIDVTTNKKVVMTVTNPSLTNAISVRCDLKLVDATFAPTNTNCPGAAGDTINVNKNCTNSLTVAANTTTTLTFDYAGGGYEYNTTCGGAWSPTTYTIPAAAWTRIAGLYIVINGGAGESWCAAVDGTCSSFTGTVLIEDLKIGAVPASVNSANALVSSSVIYPNPTSDNAKIELELKSSSNVKVTLSDVMGKEVMVISEGTVSSLTKEFSVANLNKGIYTVNYMINGTSAKSELLMVK